MTTKHSHFHIPRTDTVIIPHYYYHDLFAPRNAYKINKHIDIVCRQKRTTENTLSDKQ